MIFKNTDSSLVLSKNSKLDRNDNLVTTFEAKLTLNNPQVQSPSIVFVGAVDTIFLEVY